MPSPTFFVGLSFAAVVALFAALVRLDDEVLTVPLQPPKAATEEEGALDAPGYAREVLRFPCSGELCDAWLYMPKAPLRARPPVVLMAHGLGGQKTLGLHDFASTFASAGLAALVFDYRTFGRSTGEPRHWVAPWRHLQDWHDAVAFVRSPAGLAGRVDGDDLSLWGTSFSGGHVLFIAKSTPNVTAVVSQVPHLNGFKAALRNIQERGLLTSLRLCVVGLYDVLRTTVGLTPAYVPLTGDPDSMAIMSLDEQDQHEANIVFQMTDSKRMARARLVLDIPAYSPIDAVPGISAPILFVGATQDFLCPFEEVERAAALARRGTLSRRECRHFTVYGGELFRSVVAEELEFLRSHVLARAQGARTPQ